MNPRKSWILQLKPLEAPLSLVYASAFTQRESEPQKLGIDNLCDKLFGEAAQWLQIFHTWEGEVDNQLMDTMSFQRRDTLTNRHRTANQSRISETIFPCFRYQVQCLLIGISDRAVRTGCYMDI